MPSEAARSRARTRTTRRSADVYPVALGTAALFCLLTTSAVLISGPQWNTLIWDLPLGAYLLGGAGGLLTVVLSPGWARRIGSRHRGRVAVLTGYRLACAMAMGALGYGVLGMVEQAAGLVPPDSFRFGFAIVSGLAEAPLNEVVLRALGFLAPREIDPRLL